MARSPNHHLQDVLNRWKRFFPIPPTGSTPDLSPDSRGWHSRGYLPHFDDPTFAQSITFRLGDALPAVVIHRMEAISDPSRRRRLLERCVDQGWGECALGRHEIAALMEDCLLHFDGIRYRLISWCVMPNHVHVLIRPIDTSLGRIVGGWKGWVAHEANRMLGRTGRFWQEDYWDRYIRDAEHLQRVVRYIEWNPVKAGLVKGHDPRQWPWSSARRRDGSG